MILNMMKITIILLLSLTACKSSGSPENVSGLAPANQKTEAPLKSDLWRADDECRVLEHKKNQNEVSGLPEKKSVADQELQLLEPKTPEVTEVQMENVADPQAQNVEYKSRNTEDSGSVEFGESNELDKNDGFQQYPEAERINEEEIDDPWFRALEHKIDQNVLITEADHDLEVLEPKTFQVTEVQMENVADPQALNVEYKSGNNKDSSSDAFDESNELDTYSEFQQYPKGEQTNEEEMADRWIAKSSFKRYRDDFEYIGDSDELDNYRDWEDDDLFEDDEEYEDYELDNYDGHDEYDELKPHTGVDEAETLLKKFGMLRMLNNEASTSTLPEQNTETPEEIMARLQAEENLYLEDSFNDCLEWVKRTKKDQLTREIKLLHFMFYMADGKVWHASYILSGFFEEDVTKKKTDYEFLNQERYKELFKYYFRRQLSLKTVKDLVIDRKEAAKTFVLPPNIP